MTTSSKQAPAATTFRQYEKLWQLIASPDHNDAGVPIVCPARAAKRIIQAVRKEKVIANNTRKALGMPRFGEMSSTIEKQADGRVRIVFKLSYNGDML